MMCRIFGKVTSAIQKYVNNLKLSLICAKNTITLEQYYSSALLRFFENWNETRDIGCRCYFEYKLTKTLLKWYYYKMYTYFKYVYFFKRLSKCKGVQPKMTWIWTKIRRRKILPDPFLWMYKSSTCKYSITMITTVIYSLSQGNGLVTGVGHAWQRD